MRKYTIICIRIIKQKLKLIIEKWKKKNHLKIIPLLVLDLQ